MASRKIVMGTGAALAGVGGLAAAAVTSNPPVEKTEVKTIAQPVETRTVVIRKVEHRIKRLKPKHHAVRAAAAPVAASAPVVQAASVVRQAPVVAAPVVQTAAPVRTRTSGSSPVVHTAPVRTRTSGGAGGGGGEHEDSAEHNDD